MPPYIAFQPYGIAPLALDYADRPAAFTTENG
jgi:hypothetical protein